MAEKVNKMYNCCQYDFAISLLLVYLWRHLSQSTSIALQFIVLSRNWCSVSRFRQQIRQGSASMTVTCISIYWSAQN